MTTSPIGPKPGNVTDEIIAAMAASEVPKATMPDLDHAALLREVAHDTDAIDRSFRNLVVVGSRHEQDLTVQALTAALATVNAALTGK